MAALAEHACPFEFCVADSRRVLNLLIDWVERENVGRRVPVAAV
jgi:hypothetical protein